MRIGLDVHVLTGPHQGTSSVWMNLLDALPTEHKYVLYSFDPGRVGGMFPQPHFIHRRIPRIPAFARIEFAFPVMTRRDNCDVFHSNYYGPLFGGPPLVLHVHDLIYLDFPQFSTGARRPLFATLGRASARAAAKIVTVSNWAKDRIVARYGVAPSRVHVVPTGLNTEWTMPSQPAIQKAWENLRARLPLRYALTVGRLDPRKNFAQTARAVRAIVDEGLLDGLVIVGPEDFGGHALRTELERDGTIGIVTFLSELDTPSLQAVYRHAQCLVYLSLAEGFGMPLIEAMAMGVPVIASNRTSIPEIAGNAGLVVDPDDMRSVVAAVRSLLTDGDANARAVQRGTLRAAAFSAKRMADAMIDIYANAAGIR